jgi:hypothetical protein
MFWQDVPYIWRVRNYRVRVETKNTRVPQKMPALAGTARTTWTVEITFKTVHM